MKSCKQNGMIKLCFVGSILMWVCPNITSANKINNEMALSTLVQFVNRNSETGDRELGQIQDGGVQDDIDEMSNDEILEFS